MNTLNTNERAVLRHLSRNSRASDSSISKKIGITTQAVGKIRRKLKEQGVIRGYEIELNPYALGLEVFTVATLSIPSALIDTVKFKKDMIANKHAIGCGRLLHGSANFLAIFTFTSLEESNKFFTGLSSTYPGLQVISLQSSAWDIVWKLTSKDVYKHILEDHQNSGN
ncbi:Lrp/AsnC family transcriptional regulator [Candidatus Woesearchaeota archaeon]|nr:Lrp/AsnC family transcriptional regulator [Candidatus Woesearchaeota archaeon]